MNKAEKAHIARVVSLGCIIRNKHCGGRVECHHLTGSGMGKKSSHYEVIPLCTNHHSAQTPLPFGHSVHKGTKTFESVHGTQKELLAKVTKMLQPLNNVRI